MDEETRKNMEKSLQELKDLSPGAFQAFCWVITHWELAEEMVRDEPPVTDGDIEALARRAVEEGDYSPCPWPSSSGCSTAGKKICNPKPNPLAFFQRPDMIEIYQYHSNLKKEWNLLWHFAKLPPMSWKATSLK